VWLPHGNGGVAVEVGSLAVVGGGLVFGLLLVWRDHRRLRTAPGPVAEDPWANPNATPEAVTGEDGAAPEAVGAGGAVRDESTLDSSPVQSAKPTPA
ncbi:MAG: hypothetical protein ACRDZP_05175, partial [Acidimicrobiales bacterium]